MNSRQLVWVLRAVVFVHAGLVLAQALFAGQFLQGENRALRWHEFNGTAVIMSVALVHCILAVVCWRNRLQSASFAIGSAVLYVAEGAQIGFGFGDNLALHVPLGAAIFGGALVLWFMTLRTAPAPASKEG